MRCCREPRLLKLSLSWFNPSKYSHLSNRLSQRNIFQGDLPGAINLISLHSLWKFADFSQSFELEFFLLRSLKIIFFYLHHYYLLIMLKFPHSSLCSLSSQSFEIASLSLSLHHYSKSSFQYGTIFPLPSNMRIHLPLRDFRSLGPCIRIFWFHSFPR